jgi:hypothetical protein
VLEVETEDQARELLASEAGFRCTTGDDTNADRGR